VLRVVQDYVARCAIIFIVYKLVSFLIILKVN